MSGHSDQQLCIVKADYRCQPRLVGPQRLLLRQSTALGLKDEARRHRGLRRHQRRMWRLQRSMEPPRGVQRATAGALRIPERELAGAVAEAKVLTHAGAGAAVAACTAPVFVSKPANKQASRRAFNPAGQVVC
jgi:hypothetical protein